MTTIPSDPKLDSTLAILKDGYTFIERRCREFQSDIFETRVLGEKAVCIQGQDAAGIFYDPQKFKRKGATPKRIQRTLFGEGGVQGLDGEAHQHRKQAFMSLMSHERVKDLMHLVRAEWLVQIKEWSNKEQLVIFEESKVVMCRAACAWAGVPLSEEKLTQRADDLAMMVDAFGGVGIRNIKGRLARQRSEQWVKHLIIQVRANQIQAQEGTALHMFSHHQDLNGELLDPEIAAVELLNILRPLVAVAWYDTFLALALFQYPQYRKKLQHGNDQDMEDFVQEVRRFYPFTPFLGARVLEEFEWKGHQFTKDRLVLLDVYGTNRGEKYWQKAEVFFPERFREWDESKYNFIPQGGGDFLTNHRCAGEWVTIGAMKVALDILVNHLEYDVPDQDFQYSLDRMPALPHSGFILSNVRLK